MDYRVVYYQIMNKAKSREKLKEGENHHILPKSLGGTNSKDNLVFLSYREHFIAHKLLVKFLTGEDQWKMMCALYRFTNSKKHEIYNIKSRDYDKIKREMSSSIGNLLRGRTLSDETRKKQSEAQKKRYKERPTHWRGKTHTDETKEKMRLLNLGENNPQFGKKRTEEEKAKISKGLKGIKRTPEQIEELRNRRHTDETKKEIGKHQKNSKWINNGVKNKRLKENEILPIGFIYGHRKKEEVGLKIS